MYSCSFNHGFPALGLDRNSNDMTREQYNHIISLCQPHKVFSSDWAQYYSDDFADSLLPDAGLLKGEAFRFYDGAELTPKHNRFLKRHLPLSPDGKALRLTMFSYPQGVKAEEKKACVVPDRDEVCVFFEIDEKDNLNVSIRSGEIFKANIRSYAAQKRQKDPISAMESKTFITSLSDFQDYFRDEISHFKMFCFLGELMDIDMEAVGEISKPKVHITNVVACTSKPCGTRDKNSQGGRRCQIRVDFRINSEDIAQYEVSVMREEEKLYEMAYVPEIVIEGREGQYTPKSCFPSGKQTVYWNCTDMMAILAGTERITIRVVAKNKDGRTSISETVVSPKGMFEHPSENNYIIVLDDADNEQTIYGDDIIQRQESFIERIPKKVYDTLSDTHKLILHLPEIMVKLGWLHGGLCQIHWLEGSGKSLKFPYDFFMSEERVEDFDVKNLREYFKGIRYLSFENLGYIPSNPEGENVFLYNDTSELSVILESLKMFHENLSKREDCGPVGGTETFKTEKSDPNKYVNENLFISYSLGSILGDFDDIGTALGRYSLRCYYQGWLDKNHQLGQWVLKVESVKCRFFDDFNYDDDNPKRSQFLGYWKNDTETPEPPVRYKLKFFNKNNSWLKLENASFNSLREILHKVMKNSCYDFYIHSDVKIIDDEFIKKSILIL